jgi:hypothetical protein
LCGALKCKRRRSRLRVAKIAGLTKLGNVNAMFTFASAPELLQLLSSWPLVSLLAIAVSFAATLQLRACRSNDSAAEEKNAFRSNDSAAEEKNAFTAALTGFFDSFKKSAAPRALPRASYADKVLLVTGANTGLGFGIAQRLAELQCEVIVVCRSNPEETAAKLRSVTGNSRVSSMCATRSRQCALS